MISKRRISTVLLVLFCGTFVATQMNDDFKFEADDLQIVNSDPTEAIMKTPSRYLYAKEVAQCPSGESKTILTLLLKSLRWSDVSERKKEKAIKKLSRFFMVPRQFITVSDIHTSEILEMLKHSINKSNNLLNTKESVARIEFMIGCGDKLFSNGKTIAHQINEQVKEGGLDELSGLPFNWWNIWAKHVKSRVQRTRRQTDGSGNYEDDEYYEDIDEEGDENEDEEEEDSIPEEDTIVSPRSRHYQLEDVITEQAYETSTHTPITSTSTTSSTTKTSTEILTTTTEPPTSTFRIVDVTLMVDKISQATTNAEENEIDEKTESRSNVREEKKKPEEESESNYDDEYDDTLPEENVVDVESAAPTTTTQAPTTVTTPRRTTFRVTTPEIIEYSSTTDEEVEESAPSTVPARSTDAVTSEAPSLSVSSEPPIEAVDYEDANIPPRVDRRIQKSAATAGKPFVIKIDENVFYDEEDKTDLTLKLLTKAGQLIPASSWIRYDPEKREIYGLPLESDVSRYEFKLRATDSYGDYVDENVDITVQQYKGYRSANHEIYIQVKLEKNYESPVDWQIRLVRGLVEALDDESTASVIVREVRPNKYESNMFTFVYTNETLPKDHCPKEELEQLMTSLTKQALNEVMRREITVRNVEKDLVGSCQETVTPKVYSIPTNTKNFPPTVRNPVDLVPAYVGQLLVFEVPKDTFHDPEDFTDLKLTLLHGDRTKLEPNHWLQFDAKNREFYGVPSITDKTQQYILVAEDKSGLHTNDALVVEIKNGNYKRDHSATFEYQLDVDEYQFSHAATKRKFIEGVARVFQDSDTSHILLKMVKRIQYAGRTAVVLQNSTLYRHRECPHNEINKLQNILLHPDKSVRDEVKATIGNDFNVQKITVAPSGKCAAGDGHHHPEEITPRPEDQETPIINQDVLVTYVLPSAIILLMLLIALLIACLLYKRRNTGKMELGDEEERKSFRSKGIPVIFQDELEEKPEIVTKSPIILKDEKPPLLPQYNGLNNEGDDDNMDQYIPPQPLLMGSRESRGKSPVTPSYRKPPPYVSP